MKLSLITFLTLLLVRVDSTHLPFSCDSSDPSTKRYPFCQTSLPVLQRARDLVSRLTLDEKIPQLVNSAPPIPRLGIPAYQWWAEALHGVAWAGPGVRFNGSINSATSFPQVILTAASFDSYLWYRIGQVIGSEARALYNAGQATGMTFWAPNINIFRDPRWGRGQETPGEDPLVTGKYAVSFVRGVQGDSFRGGKLKGHLQASACCKHFTAYDLDNWKGMNRFMFNARVSLQDLADTYQPPFQSCVQQGKASGIMCGYNRVNGVPSCADKNLLTKTARGKWGFHGYITSDCDAVAIMYDDQGYAKSPEDAVVDVLNAGMDVNCGTYLQDHTKSAVQQKKLQESEIDRALHNLFAVRIRLGLFNGDPTKQLYGNIPQNIVCSPAHQVLALEAAQNGIVLLKNSNNLLPLPKSKSTTLAVIGPNADLAEEMLLGNYAGPPCRKITPLQALENYGKRTVYHKGCDSVQCSSALIDQAVNVAKSADNVVLIMGLDQTQEREAFDRVDLVLPGKQQELISRVAKASKKPVILVLFSGGPVDISFAKNDKNIGAILWAGYPGEAGGLALAEIIFGDHNPGGRLPVTWYPQDFTRVPMTDMRMRSDPTSKYPGRTYRFYKGETVFEFGFGLSYSKYSYEFAHVSQNTLHFSQSSTVQADEDPHVVRHMSVSELGTELCEQRKFSVRVGVENPGVMAGKHPVLLFAKNSELGNGKPMKQLVGFESVILSAGEKAEVEFEINPCEHFSSANEEGLMVIEEGTVFLVVGNEEYPISILI
ncbi:hypothetical protein ACFE04_025512 [Oxalis oulophora]